MKKLLLILLLLASPAFAAQTSLMPMPKQQFLDNSARVLSGGKLYTCQPGTTCGPGSSTLKSTYTDSTGGTANANPVVLDSAGRASIWLSGFYKIALYSSTGTLIYTQDNVSSVSASASVSSVFYNTSSLSVTKDMRGLTEAYVTKTDNSANTVTLIDTSGNTFLQRASYAFASSYVLTRAGESVHLVLSGSKWWPVSSGGANPPFRGALVYDPGITSSAVVPWGAESYDTDAIHSVSTNTSRLTVPVGVTKVRLSFRHDNMGSSATIYKNGSGSVFPGFYAAAGAAGVVSGFTPTITVVAGDYFELYIAGGSGVSANGYSWFAMEIIE